ncbi:MAG: hypothetical protein ACPG77_00465 [Nannocystaceae bacterium]
MDDNDEDDDLRCDRCNTLIADGSCYHDDTFNTCGPSIRGGRASIVEVSIPATLCSNCHLQLDLWLEGTQPFDRREFEGSKLSRTLRERQLTAALLPFAHPDSVFTLQDIFEALGLDAPDYGSLPTDLEPTTSKH